MNSIITAEYVGPWKSTKFHLAAAWWGFMPCKAWMYIPLPAKSTGPDLVVMVPSTRQRGQKECIMLPQGWAWSVPKWVVPFLPTTKPGARRWTVMSVWLSLLTVLLMV